MANKIENSQELHISKNIVTKMPIFSCECGTQILIMPDITTMNKAIKEHLRVHKQLTKKPLSEEKLTENIIESLSNTI